MLLTLPNMDIQAFQFLAGKMSKPEFVEQLILGWKGVFSGLMELAFLDTSRQKPLIFWV